MLPRELHVLWDRGFASHPKQLLHHLGWENWFGGVFNTVLGSQGWCFTIPLIQKNTSSVHSVARRKLGAEKNNSIELISIWLDVKL